MLTYITLKLEYTLPNDEHGHVEKINTQPCRERYRERRGGYKINRERSRNGTIR